MSVPTARLDLRLSSADKERIERAADIRGMAVSAFVRDAVLREADNVTASAVSVTLSPDESRRVLEALGASFRPNARLRRALARATGA